MFSEPSENPEATSLTNRSKIPSNFNDTLFLDVHQGNKICYFKSNFISDMKQSKYIFSGIGVNLKKIEKFSLYNGSCFIVINNS